MKKIVVHLVAATVVTVALAACGGASLGKKAGKDFCDCLSKEEGKWAAMGCLILVSEQYKEHLGEDSKFKDPKDQKDIEAAIKKCAPELLKAMKEDQ